MEQAWTDAYDIVAGAMRTAADAEQGPASWLGRVCGHRRIGWDLAMITVQSSEPGEVGGEGFLMCRRDGDRKH